MKSKLFFILSLFTTYLLSTSLAFSKSIMTGESEGMKFKLEKMADSLGIPWGIAQINQNELLITERSGSLFKVNRQSGKTQKIDGVPEPYTESQGGLLDITLPPNFKETGWIYFTYAKKQNGRGQTALARAKLVNNELSQWHDLFVSESKGSKGRHFGSRVVFDNDGYLFMSVGDHGKRKNGQNLNSHSGSIIRLTHNGEIPKDNPFYMNNNALPEIWTYGHRNPQGMYYDSSTDRLWAIEHGPRGGDEINLIRKGINYGWATISYGKEYWGPTVQVGEGTHKEGMEQPIKYFVPSIAPCDLIVYQGDAFPKWKGNLIAASMKLQHLNRTVLNTKKEIKVVKEERLLENLGERIRALHESPEGWLYFTTDSGELMRLSPL